MAADETTTFTEAIRNVSPTIRSYYSIGWLTTADIMKGNAESVGGDKKTTRSTELRQDVCLRAVGSYGLGRIPGSPHQRAIRRLA